MHILPFRIRVLKAPKDDLRAALRASKLNLKEGDIVAISSKVVSIDEGRCLHVDSIEKETLVRREADWYVEIPEGKRRKVFTITKGTMASSAGIDQSNGNGYYILYPEDPFKSARRLRAWLKKTYGIKSLGVLLTDSTSMPLRRGAVGCALAWDGFNPLKDYRKQKDIFGRVFKAEVANIVDGLASASVVVMGEGNEQIPVAVIRGANVSFTTKAKESVMVSPEEDIYAPFLLSRKWKKKPSVRE